MAASNSATATPVFTRWKPVRAAAGSSTSKSPAPRRCARKRPAPSPPRSRARSPSPRRPSVRRVAGRRPARPRRRRIRRRLARAVALAALGELEATSACSNARRAAAPGYFPDARWPRRLGRLATPCRARRREARKRRRGRGRRAARPPGRRATPRAARAVTAAPPRPSASAPSWSSRRPRTPQLLAWHLATARAPPRDGAAARRQAALDLLPRATAAPAPAFSTPRGRVGTAGELEKAVETQRGRDGGDGGGEGGLRKRLENSRVGSIGWQIAPFPGYPINPTTVASPSAPTIRYKETQFWELTAADEKRRPGSKHGECRTMRRVPGNRRNAVHPTNSRAGANTCESPALSQSAALAPKVDHRERGSAWYDQTR